MKLVLHAGTHKTGTTTTQTVLAKNREWLRPRGIFYPLFSKDNKRAHHRFAHGLASSDPEEEQKSLAFLQNVRREAAQGEIILLSSEVMYRQVAGGIGWQGLIREDYVDLRRQYLHNLSAALSTFEVEVIIAFRDYGYFLAWLYRKFHTQQVWQGHELEFIDKFAKRFAYDESLKLFREFFPNVRTYRFEDARESGLVDHFCKFIGFPTPPEAADVWKLKTQVPIKPFILP